MLENKYQAIDVKFLPHNYHTAKRISIHSMFQLHSSLGDLAIEKGNFRNLSRSAFNAHPPFGSIPASNQMGRGDAEDCRRRGGEWLVRDSWRAGVRNESLVKPGLRAYMGAKPLLIRRAKNDNNYNGRRRGPVIKVRELRSRSRDGMLGS